MIRFIADIYLEEFDKDDDVSTRVQMGGVTGSGSDVAATLRRWAEQVEGAPGIFAVKNSGPSKSKLEGIQERGREFGQAFFEDVAAGRKTPEDFRSFLLAQSEVEARAAYPDASDADIARMLMEVEADPTFIQAMELANQAGKIVTEMAEIRRVQDATPGEDPNMPGTRAV
jgi:hypothetical protein